jgi:hypothetical protein
VKKQTKKIALTKETLRNLSTLEAEKAAGGMPPSDFIACTTFSLPRNSCFC